MQINDELIARYLDGTATTEERNKVRKYLCAHPEEFQHLLCSMDKDKDYFPVFKDMDIEEEEATAYYDSYPTPRHCCSMNSCLSSKPEADIFSDLSIKPARRDSHKDSYKEKDSLLDRMNDMLDDLDEI